MSRRPAALHGAGSPPSPRGGVERGATRALDIAIGLLALLAAGALLGWGLNLDLGPIRLTARDPRRLFLQLSIVAVARALVGCATLASNRRRLALLLVIASVLVSLVADSPPRLVGDGQEYLAMSWNLAHGRPPALSADDARELATRFGARLARPDLRSSMLTGSDGRADQVHFWMYSLVSAPAVALCERAGLNPLHGFTALNIALVLFAAAIALRHLPPTAIVLTLSGPILWWVDKAHTEVFTVALLTATMALWLARSPWALVPVGVASAQNPSLATLIAVAGSYLAWRHSWDRRLAIAAAVALLLAAIHPLYYWWRLGLWSPLASTASPAWPSLTAWLAPLVDLNLGIVWQVPVLVALAVAGAAWAFQRSDEGWRAFVVPGVAVSVLLCAFAQVSNVNHGGTLGPSRYGVWLVPLSVPAAAVAAGAVARASRQGWLVAVSVAWLAWSCYAFQPRRPENSEQPSALASWVWTHAPALDNPLPEVFAERLSGREIDTPVPIATSGCEKVLLAGAGEREPAWPPACRPVPVPALCREPRVLCYANRAAGGYGFARAPRQPLFRHAAASAP